MVMAVDGGWSWVVCGSAFLGHMLTSGFSLCVGVYFVEFLAVFDESMGTTAWVSALNFGIMCWAGPIASVCNHRYGVRVTMFLGGFLSALGLFLCSFASQFYVVLLTFGFITGVGFGFVYNSGAVAVSEYFVKYRALALGLSMTGSAIANITFPWITSALMAQFGWRGALLISSGMILHVCVGAMLIMKSHTDTQLPALSIELDAYKGTKSHSSINNLNNHQSKNDGKMILNMKQKTTALLCNVNLTLTLINSAMFLFGLSVVFTHIAAYAESQGVSPSLGRALVSVLGGAGLAGRIGLSAMSNIPCTNTFGLYIAAVALTGLGSILLAVWTSPAGMVISTCLFGFFHTAFGPTVTECIFLVAGPDLFNFAFGYVLIVMGVGWILGAPAAGMLYDLTLHYPNSFYLGGVAMVIAAVVMVPVAVSFRKSHGPQDGVAV